MPFHWGSLSMRREADPGRDDRPDEAADDGLDEEGTTAGAGCSVPSGSVCAQCPRGFTSSEPCRLPASGGSPPAS
jgi:hypothetical protein